jgi:hypothetical protein
MICQKHRRALPRQLTDQLAQLSGGFRVDTSQGFVANQQRWLATKGTSEFETPSLSPAQGFGQLPRQIQEVPLGQNVLRRLPRGRPPCQFEGQGYIFPRFESPKDGRLLGQVAQSQVSTFVQGQRAQVPVA